MKIMRSYAYISVFQSIAFPFTVETGTLTFTVTLTRTEVVNYAKEPKLCV